MAAVLVIEDDEATASEIATALSRHGHDVTLAATAARAGRLAAEASFDVVTLDRLLPDGDGLIVVERLRNAGIRAPILVLSALSDVDERIAGLRAGGDDYLTKPFSPDELAVRVEVLLRRARAERESTIQVGTIAIDLIRREVIVAGQPVRLLHMEFRLLEFLARHAGRTVSRRTLFEQVWGYHFDPGANLINVHVGRLRRKLDAAGAVSAITTVVGEGYRLDAI